MSLNVVISKYNKYYFILVTIIEMMKLEDSNNNNIILFDMAKNEMFDINDNLKTLRRKLKGSYTIAM